MRDTTPLECVYLSDTWGIHDQRWCTAIESLGYKVIRELPQSLNSTIPIVTGPLTTLDHQLFALKNPIIGLSWGFDLHDLQAANNTLWLTQLSGLIVDSQPTLSIALEAGLPREHIAMIPWGIDLTHFTSDRKTHATSPPRILTLRAHEPLYRVDTVIEAIALLKDQGISCELIVGNEGSLTKDLERLASNMGLSDVSFIGRCDERDLPRIFDDADIYVSAAQTDGTSVTLLQAMSMRIPVVVSNSPGNAALLGNGAGFSERGILFTTGDPRSLAQAIEAVLSDDRGTQARVQAAWEYVQREADWSHNISRLLPILNSR